VYQRLCFPVLFLAFLAAPACAVAQTFSLPRSTVTDPAALDQAIPVLAAQAASIYKDPDRTHYLDNLFQLQLAAGKYSDALSTLASLRQAWTSQSILPSRAAWVYVPYEIYARAKLKQASSNISFDEAYAQSFREIISKLPDWPSSQVMRTFAYYDPSDSRRSLDSDLDPQKSKDTIALPDALALVSDYLLNQTIRETARLTPPLIAADDARRYITDANVLIKTPAGVSLCADLMRPRPAENLPAPPLTALLNFSIYVGPPDQILAGPRMSAANGYAGIAAFTRGKSCSPDTPTPYIYDAEDASAVIDWIAAQPWSDGRVGMFGGSYEGFTQWAAAKRMPKALLALMPSAAAAPGQDVPMEGNVFWNFVYPWPFYTLDKKTDDDAVYDDYKRWRKLDHDWYVSGRAYRDLDKIDGTPNPTFDQWIAHPSYDAYWQAMIPYQKEFAKVKIPVLLTAGYYYGGPGAAVYYYSQLEKYSMQADHYLLIGPYDHLNAQFGIINTQGTLFESLAGLKLDPVAEIDITELRYQWFDYVFKSAPRPALLAGSVNYEVTGANTWKHAPSLATMGNSSLRFFLNSAPAALPLPSPAATSSTSAAPSPAPTAAYQLTADKSATAQPIELKVNLADRSDVDHQNGQGVIDDSIDLRHAIAFVSDPLPAATEMSGLFSGSLDLITNKKDFDFEADLFELTPQNKYVQLSEYWTRASYIPNRSRRKLLIPGKREHLDFRSIRLMSRKLQPGSRVVLVLSVVKERGRQINYGTGKDVSDETIKDAGSPLSIQWLPTSYIDIPVSK
jgi:putative CocE/NonD family hydrolase